MGFLAVFADRWLENASVRGRHVAAHRARGHDAFPLSCNLVLDVHIADRESLVALIELRWVAVVQPIDISGNVDRAPSCNSRLDIHVAVRQMLVRPQDGSVAQVSCTIFNGCQLLVV